MSDRDSPQLPVPGISNNIFDEIPLRLPLSKNNGTSSYISRRPPID